MIKHILAITLLFSVSTVNAEVPKNFDSYVTAALTVYLENIQPSVKTSELFYDYLKKNWTFDKCFTNMECQKLGVEVAKEFARNHT
ncbi:RI membrane protein [Pectobacterium phage POP12]|nr:RI membrane protein [Pectobacterium phage POP12]